MKKKIGALALAGVLVLGLSACQPEEAPPVK